MNSKYLRLHILNTTIHKKPNIVVQYYRKVVEWLKCF
jgi:hypothetical protein